MATYLVNAVDTHSAIRQVDGDVADTLGPPLDGARAWTINPGDPLAGGAFTPTVQYLNSDFTAAGVPARLRQLATTYALSRVAFMIMDEERARTFNDLSSGDKTLWTDVYLRSPADYTTARLNWDNAVVNTLHADYPGIPVGTADIPGWANYAGYSDLTTMISRVSASASVYDFFTPYLYQWCPTQDPGTVDDYSAYLQTFRRSAQIMQVNWHWAQRLAFAIGKPAMPTLSGRMFRPESAPTFTIVEQRLFRNMFAGPTFYWDAIQPTRSVEEVQAAAWRIATTLRGDPLT